MRQREENHAIRGSEAEPRISQIENGSVFNPKEPWLDLFWFESFGMRQHRKEKDMNKEPSGV
jgi:hypothetical protein